VSALLLKNARLIDGGGDHGAGDVLIENGVITAVGGGKATESIDLQGLTLAPAFTDPHAHLREPGQEVKEDLATGLAAAAAGGYASVVSMPNTDPVIDEPGWVRRLIERASLIGQARLRPAAALTAGQQGKLLTEMGSLVRAGAVAFTDDGHTNEDGGVLRRALQYSAPLGVPVMVHAEDEGVRGGGVMNEGALSARLGLPGNPASAEAARIARDLEILSGTGGHLHVQHLSTARGLELVRRAKAGGARVTAEVCPHHLILSEEALATFDPVYKVAPPLRTPTDIAALRAGLADGTINAIATDHAPHTLAEKQLDLLEAPSGIASLEVAFALLHTHLVVSGALPLVRLIAALTDGPDGVLGGGPRRIAPGQPADLVALDLIAERTVDPARFKSKARFGPYGGMTLTGWPVLTLVAGRVVHREGAAIVH
jgi:dihydroorotase